VDHRCSFEWTANSNVALFPADGLPLAVAVTVDVRALGEPGAGTAAAELQVRVQCMGAKPLLAKLRLPVVDPLRLTAPAARGSMGGAVVLPMPTYGRVALTFTRPSEHVQLELQSPSRAGMGGSAQPAAVELRDADNATGPAELTAGSEPGEALVAVRDLMGGSRNPVVLVAVTVRVPRAVKGAPLPRVLPVGASAEKRLLLTDAQGLLLALPANYAVSYTVSHPSVLQGDVVRTADGDVLVRLVAIAPGCAATQISVEPRDVDGNVVGPRLADVALVCVATSSLSHRERPLLVKPGALVHLSAEVAALGLDGGRRDMAFGVRLRCWGGASWAPEESAAQLAADMAELLGLPPDSVQVAEWRWIQERPPPGCLAAGADVDFLLPAAVLTTGGGLWHLAELLWSPPNQERMSQAWRFLDRAHGVRGAGSGPTLHSDVRWGLCGAREGWTMYESLGHHVIQFSEPSGEAVAGPYGGLAVARLCMQGVSLEVPIEVAPVREVQLGGPSGTFSNNAKNGVLVLPLRFFAASSTGAERRELLSGPFNSQQHKFVCRPSDRDLEDFFAFEPWTSSNSSFTDKSLAGLEAACLVQPRTPDIRSWASRAAPKLIEVEVVAQSGLPGDTVYGYLRRPFVPQFVLTDSLGYPLGEHVGVNLSMAAPTASLSVWTGGHALEVSLAGQLRDVRYGFITISQSHALPAHSADISITWQAARRFGGVEELGLQLVMEGGQEQMLRIRVDGASAPVPVPEASAGSSSETLCAHCVSLCGLPAEGATAWMAWLLLPIAVLLGYLCGTSTGKGGVPGAAAVGFEGASAPPASQLFGAATPFNRLHARF